MLQLLLIHIRDNEGEVLPRLKARDFHPAEVVLVNTKAARVRTEEEFVSGKGCAVSLRENYRKDGSVSSRDEVDILAVASWYRTDMPCEKFKTWKPLLHDLQQRGISSAKLFADLIRGIGDLWIVVAMNRTNNVVTYSKLEDARD